MTDNTQTPERAALLPCPWCGEQPRLCRDPDAPPDKDSWLLWCVGPDCDNIRDSCFGVPKAEAIAAWNTRTPQGGEGLRGAVERSIRVAIWNAGKWRGMTDEVAMSLVNRAIGDPSMKAALSPAPQADNDALRSNLFEILRRHDVSEQCFAEVAALAFQRAPQADLTYAAVVAAEAFIRREYADPSREPEGDWIAKEARPVHDLLCAALSPPTASLQGGEADDGVADLDYRPQLSENFLGPEPSLREMILAYYRHHGVHHAETVCAEYIAALRTQGQDELREADIEKAVYDYQVSVGLPPEDAAEDAHGIAKAIAALSKGSGR